MSIAQEQWFRCDIDHKILKSLSKRSDRPGLIHFGTYFAMLAALAVSVVFVWGSWWALPLLLIYCALWAFANATGHESCHSTTFRSRWLNELLLYVSAWMVSWEPETVRWMHAKHHTYTSIVDEDAEYALPNPIRWSNIFGLGLGLEANWFYNKVLGQLVVGHICRDVGDSVPQSEHYKLLRNARWFVFSYALIIVAAVYFQTWLPVCLLILPRFIGEPMHGVLRITQHGGLATGIQDHRLTTRSMYLGPVLQFCYCNMNFHIEHHMFPMVPFHALPKLHEQVKGQLPTPSDGVTGAMKEIMTAMREQGKDPRFVLRRAEI